MQKTLTPNKFSYKNFFSFTKQIFVKRKARKPTFVFVLYVYSATEKVSVEFVPKPMFVNPPPPYTHIEHEKEV